MNFEGGIQNFLGQCVPDFLICLDKSLNSLKYMSTIFLHLNFFIDVQLIYNMCQCRVYGKVIQSNIYTYSFSLWFIIGLSTYYSSLNYLSILNEKVGLEFRVYSWLWHLERKRGICWKKFELFSNVIRKSF